MAGDASGGIVKTGRCGLNLSVIESGAASCVDEQVSNRECDSVKLSSLLAAIAAMLAPGPFLLHVRADGMYHQDGHEIVGCKRQDDKSRHVCSKLPWTAEEAPVARGGWQRVDGSFRIE